MRMPLIGLSIKCLVVKEWNCWGKLGSLTMLEKVYQLEVTVRSGWALGLQDTPTVPSALSALACRLI